eukprot:scaffold13230_cov30-Phaeocystis_antarctica.AAC.1
MGVPAGPNKRAGLERELYGAAAHSSEVPRPESLRPQSWLPSKLRAQGWGWGRVPLGPGKRAGARVRRRTRAR